MHENRPDSVPQKTTEVVDRDNREFAALINKQITELPFLPPSFEIIPRLLLLLEDTDANSDAMADLIHVDSGLTADVLRVANSAFYGRGSRTETVLEAINRVGLREIYRIATKIVASPVLTHSQTMGLEQLDLWKHALTAAVSAQVLAQHGGTDDAEVAFTAALLHDIGKVVIVAALGVSYLELIQKCRLENKPLYLAEQRAFKMSHSDVGGSLLKHWHFPENIVSAVAAHHDPNRAPRSHARLAALVYAANILAYRVGSGYGFPEYVVHPDAAALRLINLDKQALFASQVEVKQVLEREQMPFRS